MLTVESDEVLALAHLLDQARRSGMAQRVEQLLACESPPVEDDSGSDYDTADSLPWIDPDEIGHLAEDVRGRVELRTPSGGFDFVK
jgi:hypothetical protein